MIGPSRPRAGGRVPRLALFIVALAALGVSAFLVSLASRTGDAPEVGAAKKSETSESSAAPDEEAVDVFQTCTDCHKNLDLVFARGDVPGLLYTHEAHFDKGVSDCAMCHSAKTHEPDKINKPTMTRCFLCHGLTSQAMAPGECTTCHPADFPSLPVSHESSEWRVDHGQTAIDDPFLCTSCHEASVCADCHGIDMPHPEDWDKVVHADAFFTAGAATCERCHARAPDAVDSCDRCHHPAQPEGVPWRQAHPEVVKAEGGEACFKCHEPTTCASCHVRGKEDFSADEASLHTGGRDAAAEE